MELNPYPLYLYFFKEKKDAVTIGAKKNIK
jgi:hypothetical protein